MGIVKVGVIGVGHLGRHHARIYAELLGAELVGVVDVDDKRAVSVARAYKTTPYFDYKTFFEKEKPDAVSIAVPTSLHFEIAYEALSRGIHVLVEKPVTSTVKEAEVLLSLAKEKGLILQVGHIERFNLAVQYLRDKIKDPIFIKTERMGPYVPRNNDVGVVLDLMIHDIDIILTLVDSEIEEISAYGCSVINGSEDFATVHLKFKSGCIAHSVVSRVSERRIRRLDIMQLGSYISLDYDSQELAIYKMRVDEENDRRVEFIERPIIPKKEPLKQELAHFIYCVHEGRPPLVGIEDGKKALEVAVEILHQIECIDKTKGESVFYLNNVMPVGRELREGFAFGPPS